jgi:hypothetical protein
MCAAKAVRRLTPSAGAASMHACRRRRPPRQHPHSHMVPQLYGGCTSSCYQHGLCAAARAHQRSRRHCGRAGMRVVQLATVRGRPRRGRASLCCPPPPALVLRCAPAPAAARLPARRWPCCAPSLLRRPTTPAPYSPRCCCTRSAYACCTSWASAVARHIPHAWLR